MDYSLLIGKNMRIKRIEEPGYIWFCNAGERDIIEESIAFPNYNEVIYIIHLKDESWIEKRYRFAEQYRLIGYTVGIPNLDNTDRL